MSEDPFHDYRSRPHTEDGRFHPYEVGLANRNHGAMLELLAHDITPTGAHYLLTHFDVPVVDAGTHRITFDGAFERPFALDMDELRALPAVTMPVTMECAGNGRAGHAKRSFSMPWMYEAVGTSAWTGTPLAPLIARAVPKAEVVEIAFEGLDFGYDKGVGHAFGRSLTLDQIAELDVLVVWAMNGADLLPQHGAPVRLIVPGWYGMASVKWLARITALTEPYQGFQQVQTYRFRQDADDPGEPVQAIRVKSLMIPPGVPDWVSRMRYLDPGPVTVRGRAWSGLGVPVTRVELGVDGDWIEARLTGRAGDYAWTGWEADWQATPGRHELRCRATDAKGNTQPLEPPWDVAGFANNAAQRVTVIVGQP